MGKEARFGGGLAVRHGGLVAGGGPVSMAGMAVGGDNAYARTREENLRTKQFFSHPAGDFLPTYPPQAHHTHPAFGAHASDAVGAYPPSIHLYMCQPSTYHTTLTYTRAHSVPIPMTPICTPATAMVTYHQTTRPTIPICAKICHT